MQECETRLLDGLSLGEASAKLGVAFTYSFIIDFKRRQWCDFYLYGSRGILHVKNIKVSK